MKDRIKKVMESQHMTQQVFAQFIEISPASLSSIFNDRTKPTLTIVEAIKRKIPTINMDWLILGKGDMYESNKPDMPVGLDTINDADQSTLSFAQEQPLENDLFSQSPNPQINYRQQPQANYGVRDTRLDSRSNTHSIEVKKTDKIERKITEIRVYFDDQTFETFVPSK